MSPSHRARVMWWTGWLPLAVLPAAVLLFAPSSWPRWGVMWTLALAIYSGCKWLTWRRTPVDGVPPWRHAAYLLAWPGLDAAAFLRVPLGPSAALKGPPYASRSAVPNAESPPDSPRSSVLLRGTEWIRGVRNLLAGAALFFGVARLVAPHSAYIAGWVGMAGIACALHFGSFHLLSCAWRAAGIEARPLMNKPLVSVSLGEFWGRRWNTAFRDLTHRFLFRPMTRRFGVRAGIAGGFVFSGLVHELVISVPAGGGYGGPTLFFAAQGLGILVERSRFGREIGLAHGGRGWLFTMLVLVIPAPGLFHPPFIERIVIPFMHALGAL